MHVIEILLALALGLFRCLDAQYGNIFCFDNEDRTFDLCCGSQLDTSCWDNVYTYDVCCFTGHAQWLRTGDSLTVRTSLLSTPGEDMRKYKPHTACQDFLQSRASELLSYQPWVLKLRENGMRRCKNASALAYIAEVWVSSAEAYTEHFGICAPSICSEEEVALDLAPRWILRKFSAMGMIVNIQFIMLRDLQYSGRPGRYQVGLWGQIQAPARQSDIAEYMRHFRVCGSCDFRDYGGYWMCPVGPEIKGAYSFGIQEHDDWGEAISQLTGAVVHQYDCFFTKPPRCTAPCKRVFHEECLRGSGGREVGCGGGCSKQRSAEGEERPAKTLQECMEENGHTAAADGSLLLKVDIEGMEFEVFSSSDLKLLRKFRVITTELHHDRPLTQLTVASELDEQLSALQNLAKEFTLIHVSENMACGPMRCILATFMHRDFMPPDDCRAPNISAGSLW